MTLSSLIILSGKGENKSQPEEYLPLVRKNCKAFETVLARERLNLTWMGRKKKEIGNKRNGVQVFNSVKTHQVYFTQ